jgi:transcriptional regulator
MDYRTRVTVMTLRERGIVVRRVAAMCGISPARVSQIEKQERS